MNINIYSLLYLLVGLGLGLLYFGGLWLTIKNMNQVRSPIVLTLGSFILRTGAVFLVLIYVARQGDWFNIFILLVGFIVSRIFLSRKIGKQKNRLKK
ncbi:MAG TPA: ATP synthase subunit I [Candidatus Atribacteria bacterium]|jgi:F1F0 ATPase subunit 2|nr:ATP synthase subunit I [Candidatus Atribacteria bacterium]